MGKALAKRKDETDLQFRGRLANARTQGQGRDLINPFREQHNDFETGFVKDPEARGRIGVRKVKCRITELKEADKLTEGEYKALIRYRDAWDICDRSAVRSSIDFSVKGDGDGMLAYLDSKEQLYGWQKAIGEKCKLSIFEAVTCRGKSFRQAAIDIHGYDNKRVVDDVQNHFERGVRACENVVK